jgi:phosphopantothenoylcysteine decarboxylase/phosphopantothenate--cysteine ligase
MSKILLAAGASVAIYKACDLASKLVQDGHTVRVALTPRAARLVAPQLFEALTGERAHVDEFGEHRRTAMDHIDLAAWADLLLVAPASAGLLARLAHGQADDLPSTVALALPAGRPRLIAPAMNPAMLAAPAVQRNLALLRSDGWQVVEPGVGHMACGDEGQGRLPEPAELVARVRASLR